MLLTSIPIFGQNNAFALSPGLLPQAGLDPHFVARFALFVAVLLLWTIFWGKVLKIVVRLPVIAGQIIAGIMLGPSLLYIQRWPIFAKPLELIDHATGHITSIASADLYLFFVVLLSSALTVSYLLWIAGHETDIPDILKIGVTAICAGIFGALIPIGMTVGMLYYGGIAGWSLVQLVGLGLIFSATSVSIPVAMLFAYKKMHLKSSKAALGAAVVDDIFAVILLSLFFVSITSGIFGGQEITAVTGNGYLL